MDYLMFFTHIYLPFHLFCMANLILSFIVVNDWPDIIDWCIIIFMAPVVFINFLAKIIGGRK